MALDPAQRVLKLTLEELGIVSDWKNINGRLVKAVLNDLNRKEIIGFSYYGLIGCRDLHCELYSPDLLATIREIEWAIEDGSEKADKQLKISVKKVLENYRNSDDFKKIASKYGLEKVVGT